MMASGTIGDRALSGIGSQGWGILHGPRPVSLFDTGLSP